MHAYIYIYRKLKSDNVIIIYEVDGYREHMLRRSLYIFLGVISNKKYKYK